MGPGVPLGLAIAPLEWTLSLQAAAATSRLGGEPIEVIYVDDWLTIGTDDAYAQVAAATTSPLTGATDTCRVRRQI